MSAPLSIGFVVIARNEGERLKRCIASLPSTALTVYVDSGSTDGSVDWAKSVSIEIVQLDMSKPFTAARARNVGFQRLMDLAPTLSYVQFIDGDCELARDWPEKACRFLDSNLMVCATFGRRRERYPSASVYNFLCDVEWDGPIGEARAFGGDVTLRTQALQLVGGYRDNLIAGEEPELAMRLRANGHSIARLDAEMTMHDAAMHSFRQWWLRQQRSGFAFAEGAFLHGQSQERHWVWETRRAVVWGVIIPCVCASASVLSLSSGGWGLLTWLIYPLQAARLCLRDRSRPLRERFAIAVFQVIGRFPEAHGWLTYKMRRFLGRQNRIIEYKSRHSRPTS